MFSFFLACNWSQRKELEADNARVEREFGGVGGGTGGGDEHGDVEDDHSGDASAEHVPKRQKVNAQLQCT